MPVLNSFVLAGEYRRIAPARELNELQRYILKDVIVCDQRHAAVLAYIVQHFVLLFEARQNFKRRSLAYEDLRVRLEGATLEQALSSLTGFGTDPRIVAAALQKARAKKKKHRTDLAARRRRCFTNTPMTGTPGHCVSSAISRRSFLPCSNALYSTRSEAGSNTVIMP